MTSLSWHKAVRVPWLALSQDEVAAGWPDAFSIERIARLQYPREGTDEEKRKARKNQEAIIRAMRDAATDGGLEVTELRVTEDVKELRTVPDYSAPRHTWSATSWGEAPRLPMKQAIVKVGEQERIYRCVTRTVLQRYLQEQGERPSEHISAWFASAQALPSVCADVANGAFDSDWPEAVVIEPSSFDDWLNAIESPSPQQRQMDSPPDWDAPQVANWLAEHIRDENTERRASSFAKLEGPHGETWRYHSGIERETGRLAAACRESTGTERELNLAQLRGAENALREFRSTQEFQAALSYLLEVLDRMAAADESPTPQREAGKVRYAELRTQMAGYLTTPNTPSDIKTVQMDKAKVAGESTPRDVSKKETLPGGVTRSEILSVFPPLRGQTAEQWKKMLSDPPKWMEAARLDSGRRGIQSIWNPALFAICLAQQGKMQRRPLGAIIGRSFPEYLSEWEGYTGSFY
jgi:hypothetical protein